MYEYKFTQFFSFCNVIRNTMWSGIQTKEKFTVRNKCFSMGLYTHNSRLAPPILVGNECWSWWLVNRTQKKKCPQGPRMLRQFFTVSLDLFWDPTFVIFKDQTCWLLDQSARSWGYSKYEVGKDGKQDGRSLASSSENLGVVDFIQSSVEIPGPPVMTVSVPLFNNCPLRYYSQ